MMVIADRIVRCKNVPRVQIPWVALATKQVVIVRVVVIATMIPDYARALKGFMVQRVISSRYYIKFASGKVTVVDVVNQKIKSNKNSLW